MNSPSVMKAALWYARALGWRVHPVAGVLNGHCSCGRADCETPGKHPLLKGWPTAASSNVEVVDPTFSGFPDANVGIATGAGSGIVVLDIDRRSGGEAALEELLAANGALPHTPEVHTGGGGRHLYFRHPGGRIANSVSALGSGLDLRADGGQVVAPPSLHISGRRYVWEFSSRPCDIELAPLPPWLLERIRPAMPASRGPSRSDQQWMDLVATGAAEGARNATLAALAGHLLRLRWLRPAIAAELLHCWNESRCRPPLPRDEVQRTIDSIANAEFRKRLRGGR